MTSVVSLSPSLATLDALAHQVAEHGVDSDRARVVGVVRAATDAGVSPVLADIVTDPREPHVARQRAFGLLLTHLGRSASTSTAPRHAVTAGPHHSASPVRAA